MCGCVSAAGVLKKVTRDRIMVELDEQWPSHGFAIHKGIRDVDAPSGFGRIPGRHPFTAIIRPVRRAQAHHDESGAGPNGQPGRCSMSTEDLERYETGEELALYREYRDGGSSAHVVETEQRFYPDEQCRRRGSFYRWRRGLFEVTMSDAWVGTCTGRPVL